MATVAVADPSDPPSRVGRVGLIEGTVSFHTGDQDQWSPAVINYPVSTGNSFWTEPDSRAEIQLGDAIVRMRPSTEFDVVALDDQNFQGQIGQGSINLRVRDIQPGEAYQIVTSHGTIQITQPGSYHIDGGSTDPANAQPTRLDVLSGAAQFVGQDTDLQIAAGQAITVSGEDRLAYQSAPAAPDDFDRWAEERDNARRPVASSRYVEPEMVGSDDLDEYGGWQQTPDYGSVWVPRSVPADWAPYRYGHWGYVEPWGWTWIDDAPWGFAPFHYGRWVNYQDRWGWVPGERERHPVYAPALVAFVGGPPEPPRHDGVLIGVGLGITIGAAIGAVGWIPLGPHEAYHPPYRTSPAYVRNVNVTNVTNVTNITNVTVNKTVNNYANARGATVVQASAMTSSKPIGHNTVAVSAAAIGKAPVVTAPPSVRPTLATTGASQRAVRAAGGPSATPANFVRPAAAPGPVAAPGRPATAVALTRIQAPPPSAHPTAPTRVSPEAAAHPAPAPASTPAPAGRPTVAAPTPAAPKPQTAPGPTAPGPNAATSPVAKPATPANPTPAAKPAEPTPAATPPANSHAPGPPIHKPGQPNTPSVNEPERPAPPRTAAPPPVATPHPATEPTAPAVHPTAPPAIAHPEPATAAPRPEARPEPQAVPRPEPQVAPARPEPQAVPARPEPQVAPHPEPQVAPARPEPQAAPRPEPRPEPQVAPRPEPRPEPQAAPRPEPRPEPQAAPRPEPRPAPAPAPAAKPEPKKDDKKKDEH